MNMKRLLLFCIVLVTSCINGYVISAELPDSWVWPTYDVSEVKNKEKTVKYTFNFVENTYEKNLILPKNDIKNATYNSPEEAFQARMSAIKSLDYKWWLQTYDEKSRKMALEKYKENGWTEEYWLNVWEKQFYGRNIKLIRKIETGEYSIITYMIYDNANKEIGGGFEFPSVLKKIKGKWYSTLDLKSDQLVIYSPWYSGVMNKSITVY